MRTVVIKIIILVVVITLGGIAAFYVFRSQKTISPISSKPRENTIVVASLKQPSKVIKEYIDDSGFSFKHPDDVRVNKKDINDTITYSNLELTSNEIKGNILIKIADTKFKSVDDLFKDSELASIVKDKEEIKIGEIPGYQAQVDNKLLAAGINQDILFIIEVDSQNQKYWQTVYDAILSSFNFVRQEKNNVSETQPLDDSSQDAVLEEDVIE